MSLNAGSLGNVFIRATRPPQTFLVNRDPTPYDTQGYELLDEWLNTVTDVPWVLVSLKGNNMSRGEVAVWLNMASSGGTVLSVTGGNNITITGTPTINPIVNVSGTTNHSVLLGNALGAINSLANGTTGMVLTAQTGADPIWSAAGAGDVTTLTGNSGGAVSPTAGNINVVGDGTTITIVGNPGTHTLTASAVGTGLVRGLMTSDGNTVTPTAGIIDVLGSNGISTTGTIGPNSVTITAAGTIAQSFLTDAGTAVPAAGVLTVHGTGGITTSGAGSTVTINGGGAGSGALVLIQTQTAGGVAALNFTAGITGTYNNYLLIVDSANCPTGGGGDNLAVQLSTNGGATYIATGYVGGVTTWMQMGTAMVANSTSFASADFYVANLTSGVGYVQGISNNVTLDTAIPSCTFGTFGSTYNVINTSCNALRIIVDGVKLWSGNVSLYGYLA